MSEAKTASNKDPAQMNYVLHEDETKEDDNSADNSNKEDLALFEIGNRTIQWNVKQ